MECCYARYQGAGDEAVEFVGGAGEVDERVGERGEEEAVMRGDVAVGCGGRGGLGGGEVGDCGGRGEGRGEEVVQGGWSCGILGCGGEAEAVEEEGRSSTCRDGGGFHGAGVLERAPIEKGRAGRAREFGGAGGGGAGHGQAVI